LRGSDEGKGWVMKVSSDNRRFKKGGGKRSIARAKDNFPPKRGHEKKKREKNGITWEGDWQGGWEQFEKKKNGSRN